MWSRYAAAQDAQKAIRTFHAMDKFKLAADYDDFLCLLRALCRNMFVEEEELEIHRRLENGKSIQPPHQA